MAALDFTRPLASGRSVGGRVTATLTNIRLAFADWRTECATRKELSRLSDHELSDIGLIRGDIDLVARRR